MKYSIPYSSYSGTAEQLCAQGNAVEFIQPWYSPISTTPDNTGLAVGGIGSAFTLTPLGNTPSFSFIPGIYIDNNDNRFNFNDFYISVAEPLSQDNIEISDLTELGQYLHFYPALFNGHPLDTSTEEVALKEIRRAIQSGLFYSENRENFERWHVELTDSTLREIEADECSEQAQLMVLTDFLNGLLVNGTVRKSSLTARKESGEIPAVPERNIEYSALYPFSEYVYTHFSDVSVKRKVASPMVRGDIRLCSLPAHWNEIEVSNLSDSPRTVTLVQSMQNLTGSNYRKQRPGVQDSACELTLSPVRQNASLCNLSAGEGQSFKGVLQSSDSPYSSDIEGEILFGVQTRDSLVESGKVTVSAKPRGYSVYEEDNVVAALGSGRTNAHFDSGIYSGREALASQVVVRIELEPGESVSVRFAMVMDQSRIALQEWHSHKAYTRFYPQEQRAVSIMEDLLPQADEIEAKIVNQQKEYLSHTVSAMGENESAVRFATMAMNTLSFLADATVWDTEDRFLVKECVDYPFFNSLDVYFYGSFSLLYLLPQLDGCVMKEFSRAILAEDSTKRRFWEYEDKPHAELIDAKFEGVRAVRGAVIHDLGSPFDIQPDAYTWHNVKEWKDLAPKFVLMVLRHYQQTGDLSVVEYCWQAVKESIAYLVSLTEEGDALPLTRGTDDTFDNLASHGVSVYCASLWVAGLYAGAELAKLMNDESLGQDYTDRGNQALKILERGLWDEQKGYFHFYITPVQTRHLTGEGYQELETIGLYLTGNKVADKEILNEYLDSVHKSSEVSKTESRYQAKRLLLDIAPNFFTEEYRNILEMDSDNSFGDALLADSYLKLLKKDGLFSQDKVDRALEYVFDTNFRKNSPRLGIANMTLADGMPHEAFQAQDVWIGVQFSVAAALRINGNSKLATELTDTVYDALYHLAKIPFAAPEGFNCSVKVTKADLCAEFSVSPEQAGIWLTQLTSSGALLNDGRVSPFITADSEEFSALVSGVVDQEIRGKLHSWLLNTGLKYTAGRYFRPGMIFACLPEALI